MILRSQSPWVINTYYEINYFKVSSSKQLGLQISLTAEYFQMIYKGRCDVNNFNSKLTNIQKCYSLCLSKYRQSLFHTIVGHHKKDCAVQTMQHDLSNQGENYYCSETFKHFYQKIYLNCQRCVTDSCIRK